ncbi:glycosyltransferase [Tamlana sp. 2_MG-2023]|uniref:glycosyltransferase n=1 Tax=unclassified Tamlana TaxID=2614803 RepID=UPI0026E3280A|nr:MULTISPECIES: glycosyltransferase [unclassified Tamlana]MDO6760188.1 glycosyltransferase [Tamlana sp. 2_MG-2023]MDO6790114.1 glycosyltransferase [Tamlana sp. 1_MG-2023]
MKLSIIIPTLNQEQDLHQCLNVMMRQSYDFYEVIVVDGGTKNFDINGLKNKFKNVKFISESDNGVYDAMNKGVTLASGEWLYFMGVDDSFYDVGVLESVDFYFRKKDIKLILGQIVYDLGGKDSYFVRKNKGLIRPKWSNEMWIKNTLHHQGAFYHKSNFEKEYYDMSYKILADYAFNLNLWKRRIPVVILDKKIASCGSKGMSKKYNYTLYKEDIILKTKASSILLTPLFVLFSVIKFCLNKSTRVSVPPRK